MIPREFVCNTFVFEGMNNGQVIAFMIKIINLFKNYACKGDKNEKQKNNWF